MEEPENPTGKNRHVEKIEIEVEDKHVQHLIDKGLEQLILDKLGGHKDKMTAKTETKNAKSRRDKGGE